MRMRTVQLSHFVAKRRRLDIRQTPLLAEPSHIDKKLSAGGTIFFDSPAVQWVLEGVGLRHKDFFAAVYNQAKVLRSTYADAHDKTKSEKYRNC